MVPVVELFVVNHRLELLLTGIKKHHPFQRAVVALRDHLIEEMETMTVKAGLHLEVIVVLLMIVEDLLQNHLEAMIGKAGLHLEVIVVPLVIVEDLLHLETIVMIVEVHPPNHLVSAGLQEEIVRLNVELLVQIEEDHHHSEKMASAKHHPNQNQHL